MSGRKTEKKNFASFSKKRKILESLILPVVIVVLWEIFGRAGVLKQAILPRPGIIWATFVSYVENGTLWTNLSISIIRVLKGFIAGMAAGILFGIVLGLSLRTNNFFATLVGIIRPIPMIAWIPLLILWVGIGESSKVVLIAMGSFWPILLNTIHGIQSVDPKLLEVAKKLEKSTYITIRQVILPAALPSIFTGIRLGIGTAWSCVVAAEMIAASKGIGFMIMAARDLAQPAVMFTGVLTIGLVGLLIEKGFLFLEKRLLKWNSEN